MSLFKEDWYSHAPSPPMQKREARPWGSVPKLRESQRTNSKVKIAGNNYIAENPEVSFKELIQFHDLTPQIQIGISSYSELITGTEIQINADDPDANDFIDEWIRKNNFYDKFEGLVTTNLICGNALLEKIGPSSKIVDVEEVDMKTITGKKRDDFGNVIYYEQTTDMGQTIKLPANTFIEFNLTEFSRNIWSRSLFYSLAMPRTTRGRTTAPLIEQLWAVEDAITGIMLNHAYPTEVFVFPNITNDEELEKMRQYISKRKPGEKFVIGGENGFDHKITETAGDAKYDGYLERFYKTIELGIQFPHDIMTGDFTSRASSDTTETIVMKRVRGYQRYLANKLKNELFDVILAQNGFDPEKANLQISFTTQNVIELTIDQVTKLWNDKVITLKEVRDWLQANVGMDLDEAGFDELALAREEAKMIQQQKPAANPFEK